MRHRARLAAASASVVLSLVATSTRADQSGTPFWISGQYASLAAVPPSPGWSLNLTAYGYDGRAGASRPLPFGGTVAFDARERAPSFSVEMGYASPTRVLGGQPFVGIAWGLGGNRVQVSATSSGATASENGTLWAGTDVYPIASLAWTRGVDNWMAYVTANLPVGAYRSTRLANIGIGHGAIDAGGGYTYYDAKSGVEASAVAGVTWNLENRDTDYRNGTDVHVDWAASRFVSANWALGVAGYVYGQLSGDSGSGAVLGPIRSRVAAVGPQLVGSFPVGSQTWQASLRGYWEFAARYRYEGRAIFATLAVPLAP